MFQSGHDLAVRQCCSLQAGTYALFAAEVYAWFCVGEIAGRGFTFGGYNV